MELDIEELKTEADSLGITYHPNIGADKLQAKVDAYYASQETSGKELLEAVKKQEAKQEVKQEVKPAVSKKMAPTERAAIAKQLASKIRVVTIIDNDQRVNNQTTSCKVNCSNAYFDLGQVTLPLNIPVEVRQGHIDTLREVEIPQHVKNATTGLSEVRMRPRYSIV